MDDESRKRAALQVHIDSLGAQFLQRTAGEVDALQGYLAELKRGDVDALAKLKFLAHKIHGTGATLGFSAISTSAGTLEQLATDAEKQGPPDEAMQARLLECVTQLQDEVARLRKSS